MSDEIKKAAPVPKVLNDEQLKMLIKYAERCRVYCAEPRPALTALGYCFVSYFKQDDKLGMTYRIDATHTRSATLEPVAQAYIIDDFVTLHSEQVFPVEIRPTNGRLVGNAAAVLDQFTASIVLLNTRPKKKQE